MSVRRSAAPATARPARGRGPRPPHPRSRAHHGRNRPDPRRGTRPPPDRAQGRANIVEEKDKYTGIRQTGPESLRHFKRTYKKALKRQIASNAYDPKEPLVIPIREDKLYRSWNPISLPQFNAVIVYLMDVSGSMTDDQKEIVRIEAFWIDAWLKSQYDGVTTRYIIHDAVAREVDEHTFYHTRESGGTRISSAYNLANKIIDDQHPQVDWNIYAFHFSDGDNWGEDNRHCISLLRDQSSPSATSSATDRSRAPTARANSIASSRRRSRRRRTWPCRRSGTRRVFTTRSRSSSDAESDLSQEARPGMTIAQPAGWDWDSSFWGVLGRRGCRGSAGW